MHRSSSQALRLVLLASMTVTGTLALAACGSSTGAAPAATPASATLAPATPTVQPDPSPPASAAATASASAATERTYVSGTMGCNAVKETPIEGTDRLVRLASDCPFEMSDPRVTGSQPTECDEGFHDLPELPGGVGIWETCSMVLTGQGGTWKTVAAYGTEFLKSGTLRVDGVNVYEGQGAFEGLRFVALFSASPELARLYGDGYHVSGWIEPVE